MEERWMRTLCAASGRDGTSKHASAPFHAVLQALDDPIRADLVAPTEDNPQGHAVDGLRKFAIALVSSKLASIRETAA